MGNSHYRNWWKFSGKQNADTAIHRRAGPGLLQACLEVPEVAAGTGRRCPVGQVRVTPGFRLDIDYVIHAVAPEYGQYYLHQPGTLHDTEQATVLLAATYERILQAAESNGVEALALPALSVGVGKFPAADATQVAVSACKQHAMATAGAGGGGGGGSLKHVEFVLLERYVYSAWRRAAEAHGLTAAP